MFLRYDSDRTGYISRENIKDLFRKICLPLDDDLIDAVTTFYNLYLNITVKKKQFAKIEIIFGNIVYGKSIP